MPLAINQNINDLKVNSCQSNYAFIISSYAPGSEYQIYSLFSAPLHSQNRKTRERMPARVQLQLKTGIIKSFAVLGGLTVLLLEPELPTHQHKKHTRERTFKFRPKPQPGCLHLPQTARTSRPAIKSLSKVAFPSTDVNGGDSPRLYVRWMFLVAPPSFFNRIPGGYWNGSGQKGNLRPLEQRRSVQTAINQSINSAIMVRNKLILQFFTPRARA